MCDEENGWIDPGPKLTRKLFRKWQIARRGTQQAEDMTNPVWEWLFRGRINPYRANDYFRGRWNRLLKKYDFPSEPRWSGDRFGQSQTRLADGRSIWIAGEHEDYYDPDFFIYNDVIVEHPDQRIQILGYSRDTFRPTDFHTATPTRDESVIVVIGNTGYPDDRVPGDTPVYHLDTRDYTMLEVATEGDGPGWIGKHAAKFSGDGNGDEIIVTGGRCQKEDEYIDNFDDWSLNLHDGVWTRLTDRQWPQFFVSRSDGDRLHLWQYDLQQFNFQMPKFPGVDDLDLASEIGCTPNMEVYNSLFIPSQQHTAITLDPCSGDDDDQDWSATMILIDNVRVRFVDEDSAVKILVEGQLPDEKLDSLVSEVVEKLSEVENTECKVDRVE